MKSLATVIKQCSYALLYSVLAILVIAAFLGVAGHTLLLDKKPLLTQFASAQIDDIHRIKTLATSLSPQNTQQGRQQLQLSAREINLAIAYLAPATVEIPPSTYTHITIHADRGEVSATLPGHIVEKAAQQWLDTQHWAKETVQGGAAAALLRTALSNRWVNLHWPLDVDPNADKGHWLSSGQLRIGDITLSQSLSQSLAEQLISAVLSQPQGKLLRDSWKNIHRIALIGDYAQIDYSVPQRSGGNHHNYPSLIISTEEQRHIARYQRVLQQLPQHGSLMQVLPPLFQYASRRSADGSTAVRENRAALLALSMTLGGDPLADILGTSAVARRNYTLYGRSDLAQHLLLSAGLTLIADEHFAQLIGLEKEMSDLIQGKTISAWDLLADKAGVRLASTASQSEKSARQLQLALAQLRHDSELLPDLGADFSYANDRFDIADLDQLSELIDLHLQTLALFQTPQ